MIETDEMRLMASLLRANSHLIDKNSIRSVQMNHNSEVVLVILETELRERDQKEKELLESGIGAE